MRVCLLLIFIFPSVIALGQTQSNVENSLFWQIVSPNRLDTSYLFGTIHLIDKSKYILPNDVVVALKKSNRAYFEVVSELNQKEVLALSKMKNKTLLDFLNPTQIDSLFIYTKSILDIDSAIFMLYLADFKPFIFSQLPMTKVINNAISYDQELMRIAKENEIKLVGFETYENQMGYFDKMSDELSAAMIMETIQNKKDPTTEWQELQNQYLSQKLDLFLSEFKENTALNNYLYKILILKRNEKWAKELEPVLKSNKTFIAVGAAHLAGDNGLVQKLRNRKFELIPLFINFDK